ncbi:hypothetical protein L207DRAFT_511149 [Hyaloscypha variabilis F]|uniref:N-acetyltransferase domain-containing protein n=1 Tax=Hyaloscypha variabilis (strain UAMH 11265 / GT02V1 / F) TaxID=1149755 RepID=A0A2J6RRU4_HYAVF|nr:hypothetical protein L207DRAFT_511149 [Hyaloscypha variabilis F]
MVRTNKRPRYPPPPLHLAVPSDIPAMIDLWLRANGPNLLNRVLAPPDEATLREHFAEFLSLMISDANTTVIKAVDWKDKNVVTAFGVWKKGYPDKDGGGESYGGETVCRRAGMGGTLVCARKEEKKTPLQEYITAQNEVIEKTWLKGVKHIELMVLMTDPAWQGKGIGTGILRWGIAAQENVPLFLGASPAGYPLYNSLGWNVVAEVVIDLKEWVAGAGGGDMGWGVYKSRFMLRLPRVDDDKYWKEG